MSSSKSDFLERGFSELEQSNVSLAKQFYNEIWGKKCIKALPNFFSVNVEIHYEFGSVVGIKKWREELYDLITGTFPDFTLELLSIQGKGNLVFTRWFFHGTHDGEIFGIQPSHEKINATGMDWVEIENNKIKEAWTSWDLSFLLRQTQKELKILRGLLPICSYCKKIRDDKGYWSQVEEYIANHSEAQFSHGICSVCEKIVYDEMGFDCDD